MAEPSESRNATAHMVANVLAVIALIAVLSAIAGLLYVIIPACFEFGRGILS